VRRLLLFVALLALTGLTTAFASSFAVETEDVASFTPDVSISIPATTVPPGPQVVSELFLGGLPTDLPGVLNEAAEVVNTNVQKRTIVPSTGTVQEQTDAMKYQSWQVVAKAGGLLLSGDARLYITQTGTPGPLFAALFDCPPDAGITSGTCTQFAGDSEGGPEEKTVTTVSFGKVSRLIEEGRLLRVQIRNGSLKDWTAEWGYSSSRQSSLVVTAP
jgi:hypothetical protein